MFLVQTEKVCLTFPHSFAVQMKVGCCDFLLPGNVRFRMRASVEEIANGFFWIQDLAFFKARIWECEGQVNGILGLEL